MNCSLQTFEPARVIKNGAQSPSIKVIHPSPEPLSGQPATLTQARRMILGQVKPPLREVPLINDHSDDSNAFLNFLEQLAIQYRTPYFLCSDPMPADQLGAFLYLLQERHSRLRLSIDCVFDENSLSDVRMTDGQIMDGGENIIQIQWVLKGPMPDVNRLTPFAKAGIWNHMVFTDDAQSAADWQAVFRQPDILHSWQVAGAYHVDDHATNEYGEVPHLPGRPLWKSLSDPVERFVFIDRLTQKRLLRMRVADDGESLFTVGNSLAYHFVEPNQLPDGYLDDICAMVAAGGTVANTHVRNNLKRAFLIAYATERGLIVGNSSLKHPRSAYIDLVRQKSGLDLTGFLERGYTSVRPEYRGLGIGTKLLAGLTRRAGAHKIFSVISEDNVATKIIARRNRTRKIATYFSDKAEKPVGIWMPEQMIDPGVPQPS
jgi:GNAT superfamily N-acetyltransferase